eukprot:gene6701-biopygen17937
MASAIRHGRAGTAMASAIRHGRAGTAMASAIRHGRAFFAENRASAAGDSAAVTDVARATPPSTPPAHGVGRVGSSRCAAASLTPRGGTVEASACEVAPPPAPPPGDVDPAAAPRTTPTASAWTSQRCGAPGALSPAAVVRGRAAPSHRGCRRAAPSRRGGRRAALSRRGGRRAGQGYTVEKQTDTNMYKQIQRRSTGIQTDTNRYS